MTNTFKFFAAIALTWVAIEVQYTDISWKPLIPLAIPLLLWSIRKVAYFALLWLSKQIND